MLRIVNLEEIQKILSRITCIVDLQEKRDPDFVHEVKRWLIELEKVLDNNRIAVAGNVAALRGVLIAAERGVLPTGLEIHGRYTVRKIKEAVASSVLRQGGDIVSNVIRKDNERIAEATRMNRQLIALAKAKGLIRELPSGENYTEILKALWRTLASDPDISPGTTNVEGLVGPNDALIILDRTITSDVPAK
jgi:hypothetical protein